MNYQQGTHGLWEIWKTCNFEIYSEKPGKIWNFKKLSKIIEKSWNFNKNNGKSLNFFFCKKIT